MGYINFMANEEIIITKHVIEKFIIRMQAKYKKPLTAKEAENKIVQQIKQSRLISMKGNEEHRNYYGQIFVCKRENGLLRDKLIVVTLKLSDLTKKQYHSKDFNINNVDQAIFKGNKSYKSA